MPSEIDAAERLLNLVIALVNTTGRMTKEQVRTSVAGYHEADGGEAFERMFERDKDTLRELGIPLVTVTDPRHGDDIGYRVDLDAYELAPLELTPAELGVLALAAQLWQDRALRTDTSRALTKLRAVGQGAGATDLLPGLAPRVRPGGGALEPLLDAVQARRAVRFTYRAAATGEVRERVVEPWQLLGRRGGWVLIGLDRSRGAARSFRLSRIEGAVRAVGPDDAFGPPAADELERARAQWQGGGPERIATLAVAPERAGALRARAVAAPADAAELHGDPAFAPLLVGRDVVHVTFRAGWELAEEVVGYGDAVLVLDPPDAREHAIALLRTAARLDEQPSDEQPSDEEPSDEQEVSRG
ncbi:helix-turn-helix transcriptional regulator [Cellulomonas composti]|uniref:Protein PafB n=1 Tax=Cellulomonas composti TaxID=266130 RepID=A0A511J6A9_9CELL|nr:WYL domain-containing protein [Cellulomonas composti]GEL93524.1 protein PafB [Cellulomonas composti]